jgi:hypothetical protein
MEQLKKTIVDNLYKSNFYEALTNIKKLEDEVGQTEEVFGFYYFLYDLMEWISSHKEDKSITQPTENKKIYFNKINERNDLDTSRTYVKLYIFLEENFRTFDRFTWFGKKEKSINLLNQALKENLNNLEAQFYILFCEEKTKECFEFLNDNTLDTKIVQKFLNKVYFQDDFLDDTKQLRTKYELDTSQSDFIYYAQKKDYKWLHNYFNDNKSEIYKDKYISFGKVYFELKKYDEAIKFYNNKENKKNSDYFILGECYEKKNKKQKAVECYKDYYTNFTSGYWKDGLEKLFKLKAYDEIKYILENIKSDFHNKEYKIFYEAKIFNIEKQYDDSINQLNDIFDSLSNHHKDLKKDIYLLYISNYYKKTIDMLSASYDRTIKSKDFELNYFGLNYNNLHVYIELEKYIKKLNIEYDNKYIEKTKYYKKLIHNKYLNLHQNIYYKMKKIDFKLTEDKELYYLSFFDDNDSINKRIEIYKKRVEEQPENPQHYLQLGKLHYNKASLTNKNFTQAVENLKKSIKLAQKYFINLNGEPELLLVEINGSTKEENKQLFDNSMKNFIFHNSYQKDTQTTFFDQILYKYQSFSINYLSSLANNYLYFASPDKLNDPFDVASESLEKQFDNLEINKVDFKTCSLSKNNSNKLMWSHYTNEHTGLCVGYKFLYLPSYVGKDEVKYKNTNLDEKDIFQSILDYWIVKSEDWEYEQEVRLLHYGDKEKIQYTFDINKAFKDNIIALRIDSITFGLKFQEDEIVKQIIKEIENKQNLKIKIFKTKSIEQNLVVEKVNL